MGAKMQVVERAAGFAARSVHRCRGRLAVAVTSPPQAARPAASATAAVAANTRFRYVEHYFSLSV